VAVARGHEPRFQRVEQPVHERHAVLGPGERVGRLVVPRHGGIEAVGGEPGVLVRPEHVLGIRRLGGDGFQTRALGVGGFPRDAGISVLDRPAVVRADGARVVIALLAAVQGDGGRVVVHDRRRRAVGRRVRAVEQGDYYSRTIGSYDRWAIKYG